MRERVVRYLVCPVCHGELLLAARRAATTEWIEDGALDCLRCPARYPIQRGVPRFPIAAQGGTGRETVRTQRAYNFTWRQFGEAEVVQGWEKDSHHYDELIPRSFLSGGRRLGLDAGCGGGADLLRTAAGGAELIGVDVSSGVEQAVHAVRHLPNVHIVQADLYCLPFRPGTFDFIYCFGVLHHLPDPQRAANGLTGLLKPGAPLITYLYEDFSDRSAIERGLLKGVRAVRRITSRLPASVLHALCWAIVPWVWLCCSVPARLLRPVWPDLADHIPFRHSMRWPVLVSDLFDRFAPPIERRFSDKGVRDLYDRIGLERVEIRRYRGWVSWGFKSADTDGTEPSLAEVRAASTP